MACSACWGRDELLKPAHISWAQIHHHYLTRHILQSQHVLVCLFLYFFKGAVLLANLSSYMYLLYSCFSSGATVCAYVYKCISAFLSFLFCPPHSSPGAEQDLTKVLPVTTADAHVSSALPCLPTYQWGGRCVCVFVCMSALLAELDSLIRLMGECVYTVHVCGAYTSWLAQMLLLKTQTIHPFRCSTCSDVIIQSIKTEWDKLLVYNVVKVAVDH